MESPSVYIAQWKPFYNKAAQVQGLLIAAIGAMGILGYWLQLPLLLTVFEGTPPIAILTAVSFLFLGVAVCTILDTQPYDQKPAWLWPIRWLSVMMSGFIGLLCLFHYLILADFNIHQFLLIKRAGPVIPTIVTSFRIFLASVGLLLFLLKRQSVPVVVYGIGTIALYLIYTSLLAYAGHMLNLPMLYDYMISVSASTGFVLLGVAMLVATLPYEGILLPLLSREFKSRVWAILVILLSVFMLMYGISTVMLTSDFMSLVQVHQDISFVYMGVEAATVTAALLVGLISLRAIHYRNESLYLARQEALAAKAMKLSEERLRRLVDSNILAIFYWRLDGQVSEANDAYLNMMGYSRDDLDAGRLNWLQTIPPEDQAIQAQNLDDLRRHKAVQPHERQYLHKDGTIIYVLAAYAMFEDRDDSGIGFMLNITERKRIKQQLQEQLELNRTITDNATSALCLLDVEGRIIFWNPAAVAISGYTEAEVKGKTLHEVVHHCYPDGSPFPIQDCPLTKAIRDGHEFEGQETFWIRKNGKSFPVRWTVSFLSVGQAITGAVVEACDTSIEKHFEREIENIKYALNVSTFVDITDTEGDITFVNDAFCKLTKYSSQELIGQNMRILNSRYHPPEFIQNLWSTIKKGQIWSGEFRNVAKDGSIFWVYTTIVPHLGEDGKPDQYIAIRYDITERKRMEQLLLERERILQEKNLELDQFVTFASHDLKTPLRKIKNLVGFLQESATPALSIESLDFLKRIHGSVESMETLINDLLQLAKSSKETISIMPVDLSAVVAQALLELDEQIQFKQAEIHIDAACSIHGDKTQLQMLFTNLIENAMKFQKPGVPPVINIVVKDAGQSACEIQIQDNGIGFDEKLADRIFLAFERLHGKSDYPGTGVGLAICKKIVERHHGSITAHSKPGQGATFIVQLPMKADSSIQDSAQAVIPLGD